MFMAETWLKDSNNFQTGIFKECSNLTFYNVIRDSNTWGGGVGILIKSDLDSIMIKVPNYESFEVIVVSVRGGSNTGFPLPGKTWKNLEKPGMGKQPKKPGKTLKNLEKPGMSITKSVS